MKINQLQNSQQCKNVADCSFAPKGWKAEADECLPCLTCLICVSPFASPLFRNPVRMHLCVALEVWYSSYMLQFQGHCTFCVSWHWQGWRKEDHYSRPVECVLCVQKGGWGTIVITVDNHCHCTKMHQNCFLLRCTALVLWCGTSDEKLLVWSCETLVMFASKCYL